MDDSEKNSKTGVHLTLTLNSESSGDWLISYDLPGEPSKFLRKMLVSKNIKNTLLMLHENEITFIEKLKELKVN